MSSARKMSFNLLFNRSLCKGPMFECDLNSFICKTHSFEAFHFLKLISYLTKCELVVDWFQVSPHWACGMAMNFLVPCKVGSFFIN